MKDTPKYPSSRRTGDVGESQSSKAPKDFKKPKKTKVIETFAVLPSAKKTIECGTISSKMLNEEYFDTLPQNYKESEVEPEAIVEEKYEYIYKVPAGYEHIKPTITEDVKLVGDYVSELETRLRKLRDTSYESIDRLMKAICTKHAISPKKLHDDFKAKHKVIPDEWIDAQTPKEKPKTQIEKVAEQLRFGKKEELTEDQKSNDRDRKIAKVEQELINLRKITLETAQGTIVHGLGQGTGSGEVNLSKMDDVIMDAVQDGDHLIWDATLGKWIPSSAVDGGGGTNGSILIRLFLLEEKLHSIEEILHEHVDDGGDHENYVGELVEMEGFTDRSLAQQINFSDHSIAYIALQEALQGDHFHYAAPLTDLVIRVEDGTQFVIPTPEDHLPILVEPELNSDYYGTAREIDFSDANLKLLSFEESNQHQVFAAEGELIFQLEDNTPIFLPTGELYGFQVDDGTDLTSSNVINWGEDITLLNQEGPHYSPSVLEPQEGNFVELEQQHTTTGYNYDPQAQYNFEKFYDFEADGDTTVFTVTQDTQRNVYQLDGIPQPTVQLPRGDIIGFDIRNLEDKESFTIFADGQEVLSSAVVRTLDDNMIMVYTGLLDPTITKMYYRHRTIRGLGWVIVITDH